MEVQVHEYAWMWQRLGLSLAECRVFAFIYGLTKSKKYGGYDGSKRQLAAMLGLSKTQTCVCLNTLIEKQLVGYIDGKWQSVLSADSSVRLTDESVLSADESVLSADSPHTPLYNNINKNNQSSFAQIAREEEEEREINMDNFNFTNDFLTFWKLFNPAPEFANRKIATAKIFDEATKAKQIALLRSLPFREGEGVGLNPYFYVNNFPEPTPTNLNGTLQGAEMLNANQAKTAFYDGKWGLYSLEDIQLFSLKTLN